MFSGKFAYENKIPRKVNQNPSQRKDLADAKMSTGSNLRFPYRKKI